MTNSVIEARARAQAAIKRWREARKAVNDPDSVPARLDEIVRVVERTIAIIGQDIATEVQAVVVELEAVRFPIEQADALGRLEETTLALGGALSRLWRAASRAGFSAEADEDLHLPPGTRIPAKDIAKQLEAFVVAVKGVRLVLDRVAAAQVADSGASTKQRALVANMMEKASVKIEIIGIKTGKISLVDVTGLATLARELGRLLQSFIATVGDAATRFSTWLSQEAPGWIKSVLRPLELGATHLAKGAAAWIRRRSGHPPDERSEPSADPPPPAEPRLDLLEIERMIVNGEVPPAHAVPCVTSFSGWDLDQKALFALGHMKALRKLSLNEGAVGDLSLIAGLTALQSLRLQDVQVEDLSPLADLVALQYLEIHDASARDLSPLAGLVALQDLYLAGSQASNLAPLANLTALQSLSFSSNQASDLAPLANLTALRSLFLASDKLCDLDPLAGLTALESLTLHGTEVNNITPLAGLTALHYLSLGGTKVKDLSPLASLTALQILYLDRTKVGDLTPLAGLLALRELHLSHTWVDDLGPLAGLSGLENLDLTDTEVVDLGPIGGLSKLQSLSLGSTKVRDLSPLRDLQELREIHTLEENIALIATLGLPVKWYHSHYVIDRAA